MVLGDLNFVFILFFVMFTSIALNVNTALHLLLTAELLWITLYVICLVTGILFDNMNILSLTFFFLILSAVEFGLGLIIMLVQHIIFRSINLNDSNANNLKFSSRFNQKLKHQSYKVL
jgi:NADH:ubiquinone oxidoreductase subunit K